MSYAPTAKPGDQRRRIHSIVINNPNVLETPGAKGTAVCYEQDVVRVADAMRPERAVGPSRPPITLTYDDPGAVMEMRHPGNDSVIGTMTLLDAMIAIYSLGRHAQLLQDQKDAQAQAVDG